MAGRRWFLGHVDAGTDVERRSWACPTVSPVSELLPEIYDARFDDQEAAAKDAIWREIVRFLQRYIDKSAPIMDLACDRGHFIRWVRGSERWASDIRDVRAALPDDVQFVQSSGLDLAADRPERLLRHGLHEQLSRTPRARAMPSSTSCASPASCCRPSGRVIVLQPNIRLIGGRYWDFIDHKVALTERSLVEAAELAGLQHGRPHHALPAVLDQGAIASRCRGSLERIWPSGRPGD